MFKSEILNNSVLKMSKCENVNMSKCIIVTLNLRTLFYLLQCQINHSLLMQVNNANILKTIGMLCNAVLL